MTPPTWFDTTPEAMKRALWEQAVMRWLFRTQPRSRAVLVILGYINGRRDVFEDASARMRLEVARPSAIASGLVPGRLYIG